MNESYIKIPIYDDGVEVHGTLRGGFGGDLIILAPGLGGWMHDLQMFNASRYFEDAGYSTLRLSFYGHDDKQRNISDFGVKENARDIDAVVQYVIEKGCTFVAVAGHSYSGLAIVYATEQAFNTGILWDPTHTDGYETPEAIEGLEREYVYIDSLKSYVSGIGPGYVLSKKVFHDHGPGSREMVARFTKPLLVINADGHEGQIDKGLDYINYCPTESKQIIIPNSSHSFTENGAMDNLFKATLDWIEKIKKKHENES